MPRRYFDMQNKNALHITQGLVKQFIRPMVVIMGRISMLCVGVDGAKPHIMHYAERCIEVGLLH